MICLKCCNKKYSSFEYNWRTYFYHYLDWKYQKYYFMLTIRRITTFHTRVIFNRMGFNNLRSQKFSEIYNY